MTGPSSGGSPAPRWGPLVSTGSLASRLDDPALVVLDASWYLPGSGRDAAAEYRDRHIPGAVFFDLDRGSDEGSPWPHMFPDPAELARYAGGLGVGPESLVAVYDGSGANLSAARVRWMLRQIGVARVAVLDGGMGKWMAEGRPVRSGIESRPAAGLTPSVRDGDIVFRDGVRDILASRSAQIVDVRAAERFSGRGPEPRPGIPSGHVPGAINLPHTELVAADGTLLAPGLLRERMGRAGVDPARPVVAMCGSGTSACALLLALETLGTSGHRLYDGSWTEWAGSGMPVAVGD